MNVEIGVVTGFEDIDVEIGELEPGRDVAIGLEDLVETTPVPPVGSV